MFRFSLLFALCFALTVPCFSQISTYAPVVTNATATILAPLVPATASSQSIVLNSDGSISVSPDILSFLPVKYRTLIILLCALALPICKFAHGMASSGTIKQSALSAVGLAIPPSVMNELVQLKTRTALPQTPAPPAPKPVATAPAVPAVVPLTNLPPTPPPVA